MSQTVYADKTLLTGGTSAALDSVDGALLLNGDMALVPISNILYCYVLDDDSGAAESSPGIIAPDTNAGTKRWILNGVRQITVGSDADGDTYYRASGLLARLAKGAANLKMFMNAAATAPEWAKGIKVGAFTRDLADVAGDVGHTSVGFKCGALLVFAAINASTAASWGMSDGTNEYNINQYVDGTMGPEPYFIKVYTSAGNDAKAVVKSFDSDGFTLTWSKTNNPTGSLVCYYVAFR